VHGKGSTWSRWWIGKVANLSAIRPSAERAASDGAAINLQLKGPNQVGYAIRLDNGKEFAGQRTDRLLESAVALLCRPYASWQARHQ